MTVMQPANGSLFTRDTLKEFLETSATDPRWYENGEPVPPPRRAWRAGTYFLPADLSGETFSGLDLSGLNLEHVWLTGADLQGARLVGANLRHANLSGANLSGADLSNALLDFVHLTGANLDGAMLPSPLICLPDGEFTAYTYGNRGDPMRPSPLADEIRLELRVPAHALRVVPIGRDYGRVSEAVVVRATDREGREVSPETIRRYGIAPSPPGDTAFKVGDTIRVESFDPDPRRAYSSDLWKGIGINIDIAVGG